MHRCNKTSGRKLCCVNDTWVYYFCFFNKRICEGNLLWKAFSTSLSTSQGFEGFCEFVLRTNTSCDNCLCCQASCSDAYVCGAVSLITKAVAAWRPTLPTKCLAAQDSGEKWKCFFGHVIYPHIQGMFFLRSCGCVSSMPS